MKNTPFFSQICLCLVLAGFGFASVGYGQTINVTAEVENQVLYLEEGRFGGWPANNGGWSWGDEILVGFDAGWSKVQPGTNHQIDWDRPKVPGMARSLNGGRTWKIEFPSTLTRLDVANPQFIPISEPMHFANPGFAMTIRNIDNNKGPSYFFYTYDRGKTWQGPYEFPPIGVPAVLARTDYIVISDSEALVFLTAARPDLTEGHPYCIRTNDGGLTWTFVSYIGPEPVGEKSFAIMPSTVQLGQNSFVTAVRSRTSDARWIDAWASDDNGSTWYSLPRPAPDLGGGSGNAPALLKMQDGRIALFYGYRGAPYGVRARLSEDGGKSWSSEYILRDDAVTPDLGYPRAFQRKDGKLVVAYYYNDGPNNERFIAATTWAPPARSDRSTPGSAK